MGPFRISSTGALFEINFPQHWHVQLQKNIELTDDEAVEDVGKSMHEAKQRVKQQLQAAAGTDAADALADLAQSGPDDETQASAPATARAAGEPLR